MEGSTATNSLSGTPRFTKEPRVEEIFEEEAQKTDEFIKNGGLPSEKEGPRMYRGYFSKEKIKVKSSDGISEEDVKKPYSLGMRIFSGVVAAAKAVDTAKNALLIPIKGPQAMRKSWEETKKLAERATDGKKTQYYQLEAEGSQKSPRTTYDADIPGSVQTYFEAHREEFWEANGHLYMITDAELGEVVFVPDGDPKRAVALRFWHGSDGSPISGKEDLLRAVRKFATLYSKEMEGFTMFWIDFDAQSIRGAKKKDKPGSIDWYSASVGKIFKIDSKKWEEVEKIADPGKTEFKDKLEGERPFKKSKERAHFEVDESKPRHALGSGEDLR